MDEIPTHLKLAVTAAEAGELVGGISDDTIRRLVDRGVLARVPHTERFLIARCELERWVASGQPTRRLSKDDEDARYTQNLIRRERLAKQVDVPEIYTGTDAPRDMYVEEFDGIDVLAVA